MKSKSVNKNIQKKCNFFTTAQNPTPKSDEFSPKTPFTIILIIVNGTHYYSVRDDFFELLYL